MQTTGLISGLLRLAHWSLNSLVTTDHKFIKELFQHCSCSTLCCCWHAEGLNN